MRYLEYGFFLLASLLALVLAFLNSKPVLVDYFIGQRTVPLSVVIIAALVTGGCLSLIAISIVYLRLKCENYRLRRRIKVTEKEIENLRAIPIRDNR